MGYEIVGLLQQRSYRAVNERWPTRAGPTVPTPCWRPIREELQKIANASASNPDRARRWRGSSLQSGGGSELAGLHRHRCGNHPKPGWVEHDAGEIWELVRTTLGEVASRLSAHQRAVVSIGITNQRETVVAWDRRSGDPVHRAIVWQDRRTTDACRALEAAGSLPWVQEHTGLVLDPYFSATKMQWLLREGQVATGPDLALGTVDSWVLWNLTGGTDGGVFGTDVTNASRTLLFDIRSLDWSDELCALFDVPLSALADVGPSCGRVGLVSEHVLGADVPIHGVPVSGRAGALLQSGIRPRGLGLRLGCRGAVAARRTRHHRTRLRPRAPG